MVNRSYLLALAHINHDAIYTGEISIAEASKKADVRYEDVLESHGEYVLKKLAEWQNRYDVSMHNKRRRYNIANRKQPRTN